MTDIKTIKLANGLNIPQIGLGVLRVSNEEVTNVVLNGFKTGYRQIDGAAGYENEKGVGLGIKRAQDELGISRDQMWLTSKVRDSMQGYDSVLKAFDQTINELGVDYLDMYMIHWPVPSQDKYLETWQAFEKLYYEGRVKTIAVCNFLEPYLKRLLDNCEVKPSVNQLEIHPSFQQIETVNYTRKNGIAVQAYSPMARGLDLDSEVVSRIANQTCTTPAQVILRWHIQKDNIIIPKTVNPKRMLENLDIFNFTLNYQQMLEIDALNSKDGSMGHDPHTYSYS